MNQEEICTAKMQNCITIKRCNSDYTDPHNTINLNNPFNIKVKHVPGLLIYGQSPRVALNCDEKNLNVHERNNFAWSSSSSNCFGSTLLCLGPLCCGLGISTGWGGGVEYSHAPHPRPPASPRPCGAYIFKQKILILNSNTNKFKKHLKSLTNIIFKCK